VLGSNNVITCFPSWYVDLIYHIANRRDWVKAKKAGKYVADSLQSQGFIHMSTAQQIIQVANRFYKDSEDLVLLYIDSEKIKESLRWEGKEEHGEDFPHLYASLPFDAVIRVEGLYKDENGNYLMP
jgi:uncharacterized protein (DUF952 family)